MRRAPLFAAFLALTGCGVRQVPAAAAGLVGALAVERGELTQRLLLSGELVAAEAVGITVPRTSSWQVEIRWLVEDGTEVEAGDKILELDNGSFVSDLEDKRLAVAEKKNEIRQKEADALTAEAEAVFAVEQRRAEVEKALLKASVPAELVARRDYEERQLALAKAKLGLEKAEADLAAKKASNQAERAQLELDLATVEREIAASESAIRSLSVVAPRAGMVLVADHPWEGRKLREGDKVWVGMTVLTLPELSRLRVEAELSDVDDGRLTAGEAVAVTPDAFPAIRIKGRVSAVTPLAREADRQSLRRFFAVTVELEAAPHNGLQGGVRLSPGMSVRVEAERKTAGLLAPRAGFDLAASPVQARLAAGGRVPVELGPCDAFRCVVLTGLEEGAVLSSSGAAR